MKQFKSVVFNKIRSTSFLIFTLLISVNSYSQSAAKIITTEFSAIIEIQRKIYTSSGCFSDCSILSLFSVDYHSFVTGRKFLTLK